MKYGMECWIVVSGGTRNKEGSKYYTQDEERKRVVVEN
jgi:hypothetical protein